MPRLLRSPLAPWHVSFQVAALLVVAHAAVRSEPADGAPQGPTDAVFGFSDAAGTRLLVEGVPSDPARITRAVCPGGERRVRFEKSQGEGPGDTGRALAANFDAIAGAVFRVEGAPIPVQESWAGVTCLMTTAAHMQGGKLLLPVKPAQAERGCSSEQSAALRAAKPREVTRCNVLAKLDGIPILLAEWAPQGEQMLATLVALADGRPVFLDFEAKRNPLEPSSCWRVDDDCKFREDALHVLAGVRSADQLELVLLWDGFEGENALLLRVNGSRLEEVARAYRYWAPM